MLGNIGHVHWLFLAEDLQIHIFILSQNSHFIALAPYFIAGSHRWSLVREPTAPQSASPSPSLSLSPHHSLRHHNHTSHRHCTTVRVTVTAGRCCCLTMLLSLLSYNWEFFFIQTNSGARLIKGSSDPGQVIVSLPTPKIKCYLLL